MATWKLVTDCLGIFVSGCTLHLVAVLNAGFLRYELLLTYGYFSFCTRFLP